jgi:phospholipid/cholesterol/gamma-HCH transport system substrate-binding protein
MPRTRSLAWSELKIGVLTITAVVIAAVAIFLVTGGTGFFWQRYSLKTRFPSVAGLKPGSPVRLAGIEVGTVVETPLAGDQVDVVFEVNEAYSNRITTESVATLGSVSLLGVRVRSHSTAIR